jgi:predicted RNase H-like HicB family nuclease
MAMPIQSISAGKPRLAAPAGATHVARSSILYRSSRHYAVAWHRDRALVNRRAAAKPAGARPLLSDCAKSSRAVRRKVANLADRAAKSSLRRVSQSLRLTIVFEPDAGGWIVASVPEVPGALSQGRTREEARENVIDALHGILELRFCEHALAEPAQDSESLELRIAA